MTFKDLNLIPEIEKALEKQGYTSPTPIQSQAIPVLLEGKDLIGIAQTGTGKTAAFVLPMLQRMSEKHPKTPQALILAPTRELALQIGESFSQYGEFLKFRHTVIFGGVNQSPQVHQLMRGVDVIISTPGRLLDLMDQGKLSLSTIEYFVLDEADRMLDMGFIHDINKIIARLPQKRQSLFFSATMSKEVNELARKLLRNPEHIEVASQATPIDKIKQHVFFVEQNYKERLLLNLLNQEHLTKVLVFTKMKHRANKLARFLQYHNIEADAIHGNKTQNARIFALNDFKEGRIRVLVATDIASRGIDIEDISHVINFDLPEEPEVYVHRIGRTARAGKEGTSYSFCSSPERELLRYIEKLIRMKIEVLDPKIYFKDSPDTQNEVVNPDFSENKERRYNRNDRYKRYDHDNNHGDNDHRRPRQNRDERYSNRFNRDNREHRDNDDKRPRQHRDRYNDNERNGRNPRQQRYGRDQRSGRYGRQDRNNRGHSDYRKENNENVSSDGWVMLGSHERSRDDNRYKDRRSREGRSDGFRRGNDERRSGFRKSKSRGFGSRNSSRDRRDFRRR